MLTLFRKIFSTTKQFTIISNSHQSSVISTASFLAIMSHNYRTPTTLTKHTTACRSSQRSILSHTDTKQTHKVCASMEIEPSRAFTPSSSSRFVTNVHFMPLKMTLSNARTQPRVHHCNDRSIDSLSFKDIRQVLPTYNTVNRQCNHEILASHSKSSDGILPLNE